MALVFLLEEAFPVYRGFDPRDSLEVILRVTGNALAALQGGLLVGSVSSVTAKITSTGT